MSHALDASVVTEMITLWLGSLEGAPDTPPSTSLVESMTYVALYNVVLKRCAKLVLKLRTHSLALAKHGSETDRALAEGWSLEALVTTCGADPSTPKTSWSHYIQKIVADSQEAAGPHTFGAVLLTYYKLRSVLGQMQTKGRKLGLKSVAGFNVKTDPLAVSLGESAKRLYTKTKAALGIAMDDVASESDAEGDDVSAHREKREVSLLLRQAHASSLQDANKAPSFDGTPSLFSPKEHALFTKGDDKAIHKSLAVSAALHGVNPKTPPSLFSDKDLARFTKGKDKHIQKSLETSKKIHNHEAFTKSTTKTAQTATQGRLSSVITRASDLLSKDGLVSSATALPSTVGQALGAATVTLAEQTTSKHGTNGLKTEDVVSASTALPSTVGQALGAATVTLAKETTGTQPTRTKTTKKHKLSRTLQKSKAHRRKHKVKPAKRRGNRSSSWGLL